MLRESMGKMQLLVYILRNPEIKQLRRDLMKIATNFIQ